MTEQEKCEKVLQVMEAQGLTIMDLFDCHISKDRSLLKMPEQIKSEFDNWYARLSDPTKTTKEKGDVLEKLACCLMFSGENLFRTYRNIRTSTNEIDLFVELTDKGKAIIPRVYSFLGENFLCECKNYGRTLSVTYIGKFFSLLKLSRCKFGIIFSIHGVTGRSKWSDGKGLIRKIALKEDIYILDFTHDDFERIKNKDVQFLDIVEEKYISLKNDIEYGHFITTHEAETFLT